MVASGSPPNQIGARIEMKTIVITGAGSGLGKNLTRRFAADGDKVVLLGRRLSKLEELAGQIGELALPVACDISNPDAVREAFARIAERRSTC
jgi:NAD(P)-dependent dehydrogenase (short-subunit alcohol dehydrogenase family)